MADEPCDEAIECAFYSFGMAFERCFTPAKAALCVRDLNKEPLFACQSLSDLALYRWRVV